MSAECTLYSNSNSYSTTAAAVAVAAVASALAVAAVVAALTAAAVAAALTAAAVAASLFELNPLSIVRVHGLHFCLERSLQNSFKNI